MVMTDQKTIPRESAINVVSVSPNYVFPDAESWLTNHYRLIALGERPFPPKTRNELLLANNEGLMEIYPEWRPSQSALRMLGLPDNFGLPVEPFNPDWRDRFLVTLQEDDTFRAAIAAIIRRSGV